MVRFISLSSGSSGNCYYFGNERKSFLIDVGIGARAIKKRLLNFDIPIESISAVFVTHDHFDHIKSLGTFSERYHVPVYATDKLHKALRHNFCIGDRLSGNERYLIENQTNDVDGIKVVPFEVPHDATQTVGYHIDFDGCLITVMTDIGAVTEDAVKYAGKAEHLIAESNYDIDMLMTGSYPRELKERIIMGNGHLSNEQNSHLLKMCNHQGLKDVFLCHLSGNNNTPRRAYDIAKATLAGIGSQASLHCLPRSESSELFEL